MSHNIPMGMKCIKPVVSSNDMTKSIGFSTGNYIIQSGVKQAYPSGPKLTWGADNVVEKEPQLISISYNEEKCFKCNGKNLEYKQGDQKQLFGRCKTCDIHLKLREYISLDQYLSRCDY